MTWSIDSCRGAGRGPFTSWVRRRGLILFLLISCAALGVAASVGLRRAHAQSAPAAAPAAPQTASTPPASAPQKPPAPANPEDAQKQEIANECADLLKMATDLKTAVDKTTSNTLSVSVIRKASAIEQLAHKVRTGSPKG